MKHKYVNENFFNRWHLGVFSKTIPLVLFFLMPFLALAQTVTIGNGTSTQRYPLGNYFGFERSSSIYLSSEINQAGLINAVEWYANTPGLDARPIKIYLKEVTSSEHPSSVSTWANEIADATLVYSGSVTPVSGWNVFNLDTSFDYSGGNLKVLVEANYGGGGNSGGTGGNSVRYTTATNRHAYWQADNNPPTSTGTRTSNRPNIQLTLAPMDACSGTPDGGTASLTPSSGNAGSTFLASVTGATFADGIIYQWQKNVGGWTDIAGATSATSTITAENGPVGTATNYRLKITCTNSGSSAYSTEATHTISLVYCTPTGSANNGDEIRNFTLSNLNNNSAANEGTAGYSDYSGTVSPALLSAGVPYQASLTSGSGSGNHGAAIWIDLNNNGTFEASEMVTFIPSTIGPNATVYFPDFAIPTSTPLGTYRLRVQYHHNKSGAELNPCTATSTYSETEDYAVTVLAPPSCVPPAALTATNILDTGVTLSWTENNAATSWEVEYGPSGFTQGSGTVVSAGTNPFNLSGLTPNTSYSFYVRTICSTTDSSSWSGPMNFKTACGAVTDLFENFDGYGTGNIVPDCWIRLASTTSPGQQTITATTPASGTRNIYQNASTTQNPTIVVLPLMSNINAGTHWLRFKARVTTTPGALQVGYVTDVNDYNSFTIIETLTLANTAYTADDAEYTIAVPTSVPADARLAIKNPADGKSYYWDDVYWEEAPSCIAPSSLTMTGATPDSVSISWTANNSETSWTVVYGAVGFDPATATDSEAVSGTPAVTLTDLTANTAYDVYVKASCGAGDESDWAGPLTVRTACSVQTVLPYTEDFESYGTGSDAFPPCWERPVTYTSGTVWPSIVTYSGSKRLRFQSLPATPTYAVSPAFAEDINNLRVSFQLRREGDNSGTLDIGVMSDPDDLNTFELIETINPVNGQDIDYMYDLNNTTLSGSGNFIAFRHNSVTSSWYYWLDNFQVELIPSCPAPTAITATYISATTADISWTAGGTETEWIVAYGAPGMDPNSPDGFEIVEGTPAVSLTGLTANTAYEVYIQASCAPGDDSTWTGPFQFRTSCVSVTALPFLETFEDDSTTRDCWNPSDYVVGSLNWTYSNGGQGGGSITSAYAGSKNALFYQGSDNNLKTRLVAPTFDFTGKTGMYLEFYYSNELWGSSQSELRVFYKVGAGDWTLIPGAEYSTSVNAWTLVHLELPESDNASEYYIAFEGTNQYSRGITIDEVTVNYTSLAGYVYQNGTWSPEDPSGVAGEDDDIFIIDGSATVSNVTGNNITINSGASLDVTGILNVHGDLTIDGNLIFKSTATGNGELGVINGTISGNATVERYMQDVRSYRMVTSSVTTTTSIRANWQEDGASPAGFGTHISGSTGSANGFDDPQNVPAMFTLDGNDWTEIDNTNVNTLDAGTPYLLMVRGDRTIDPTDNTAHSETVLRATGVLATGDQTQSFASAEANSFVMFGNAYQSAVDVNALFNGSTNVNPNFYYIYSPEVGTNGGFVTVDLSDGSNGGGYSANEYLQPGQAALFTTAATGTSAISFTESVKAPGNHTTSNATENDDVINVRLFTNDSYNSGKLAHDTFTILFADNHSNDVNAHDARKPMNFNENLAVDNDGTLLSIERREMPAEDEVYQLYMSGFAEDTYLMRLEIIGLADTVFLLEDAYTGNATTLQAGENLYTFEVDNDPLSKATDRFSIKVETDLGVIDHALSGIRIYPNPVNAGTFYIHAPKLNGEQVEVRIADLAGRQIYKSNLPCTSSKITVNTDNTLASGVYVVTVKFAGETQTYRIVKE